MAEQLDQMREFFLEAISAYSEDHYCAGWLSGIEEQIRANGGPWLILAYYAGGWPKGYRAEHGWEQLSFKEIVEFENFKAACVKSTRWLNNE